MTLTLNTLFKQVNERTPGQRITVNAALQAWAEHPGWQVELQDILAPCAAWS